MTFKTYEVPMTEYEDVLEMQNQTTAEEYLESMVRRFELEDANEREETCYYPDYF